MGKSSEGIAANCDSENGDPGSGEAHDVGSRTQEDRGVSAGKVGEVEGGAEEGGLEIGRTRPKRTTFIKGVRDKTCWGTNSPHYYAPSIWMDLTICLNAATDGSHDARIDCLSVTGRISFHVTLAKI
jgi:hypothetical protein